MIKIKPRYSNRNEQIIAGMRAIAGAQSPVDPVMSIKHKSAEIAISMALLHGGDWHVNIDHQQGFVLVTPRP